MTKGPGQCEVLTFHNVVFCQHSLLTAAGQQLGPGQPHEVRDELLRCDSGPGWTDWLTNTNKGLLCHLNTGAEPHIRGGQSKKMIKDNTGFKYVAMTGGIFLTRSSLVS